MSRTYMGKTMTAKGCRKHRALASDLADLENKAARLCEAAAQHADDVFLKFINRKCAVPHVARVAEQRFCGNCGAALVDAPRTHDEIAAALADDPGPSAVIGEPIRIPAWPGCGMRDQNGRRIESAAPVPVQSRDAYVCKIIRRPRVCEFLMFICLAIIIAATILKCIADHAANH